MPQIRVSRGIVFDVRGMFGGGGSVRGLPYFYRDTLTWGTEMIPTPTKPDRLDMEFMVRPGTVTTWLPGEPYITARRAFLTNASAISAVEGVMDLVEGYKIGEIVGEPTAGTNGAQTGFTVPGRFEITWTGEKYLKHDGTQLHGIGIRPTVPTSRTRAGVAAGRDEMLERALALVR